MNNLHSIILKIAVTGTLLSIFSYSGFGQLSGSSIGNSNSQLINIQGLEKQFSLAKNKQKKRSKEWKKLTEKQSWELADPVLPKGVDLFGFDEKNTKIFHSLRELGFELSAIPSTDKIKFLGQIIGAQSLSSRLNSSDTVFIESDQSLQVGETYAVTELPTELKSPHSDRVGYSYPYLGRVQIIGVRDQLFIGELTFVQDELPRGAYLIPVPPRVKMRNPIVGPKDVQGIVLVNQRNSTSTSAQHKQVFIDRGLADGVKPGMIFRVYDHRDPSNGKKVTDSNYIVNGDLMIMQSTDDFSSALILHSFNPIRNHAQAILLSSLNDFDSKKSIGTKDLNFAPHPVETQKNPSNPDLEKLSHLDKSDILDDKLGKQEERDLAELENWRKSRQKSQLPIPLVSNSPSPVSNPPLESTEVISSPLSSPEASPSSVVDPSGSPTAEKTIPVTPLDSSSTPLPASTETPSQIQNEMDPSLPVLPQNE